MNLDDGRLEGAERVEDRNRCVRERGRVDHDAGCGLPRLVNPIDQFVLAVALVKAQFQAQLAGQRAAVTFYIGQGLVSVDVRLAPAQQVQVRTVQNKYKTAHVALGSDKMATVPLLRQTSKKTVSRSPWRRMSNTYATAPSRSSRRAKSVSRRAAGSIMLNTGSSALAPVSSAKYSRVLSPMLMPRAASQMFTCGAIGLRPCRPATRPGLTVSNVYTPVSKFVPVRPQP